jgi:hypothetical protein
MTAPLAMDALFAAVVVDFERYLRSNTIRDASRDALSRCRVTEDG